MKDGDNVFGLRQVAFLTRMGALGLPMDRYVPSENWNPCLEKTPVLPDLKTRFYSTNLGNLDL